MLKQIKKLLKQFNVSESIIYLKSKKYNSFSLSNVPKDAKFRIGSNTKMYVGNVLLQLYQENKINLDCLVSDYLVGLPEEYKNLTVREVGTMKSGIPDFINNPIFEMKVAENIERNWLPTELFGSAMVQQQLFEPGTNIKYSNSNSMILGLIIERITQNNIKDEINKRIIHPLKLKNTQFQTNGELQKPYMNGYENDKNITHMNPSWIWTAGAISSTLKDSIKFIYYINHLDKKLTKQNQKEASSLFRLYIIIFLCVLCVLRVLYG